MKRFLGLPVLLLTVAFLALNCGGGGGDSQSSGPPPGPPPAFSQTDLAGTWDLVFFDMGRNAGWWRGTATINASGGVVITSGLDSAGSTAVPAAGAIILSISSSGVVTEGGTGGNASFHGQMSSNKKLVVGTEDWGATENTTTLRVFRKRTGTAFSSADVASKIFTFHGLRSGLDNNWNYGTGTTDGSGTATLTSEFGPAGPHATGPGGILAVSSVGIVTISNDTTWYGLLTDDKKMMFIIDGVNNDAGLNVLTFGGQSYVQSDLAGTYAFSAVRNMALDPSWSYGTYSMNATGTAAYLTYADSGGGATPANFSRVLSASGALTDPADATYHGQLSYNKDVSVRTSTIAPGRYGLAIGFK